MSTIDTRTNQSQVTRDNNVGQSGTSGRAGSTENFSRMLNKQTNAPGAAQQANERVAGWKTVEAALQRTAQGQERSSLSRFAAYQDVTKTLGSMRSRNKRSGDVSMDAMQDGMELNAEQNMRYLELQQRMQEETIAHECLSNLMKARAESVKNSLSAIQ
jgi:hypothetical protein